MTRGATVVATLGLVLASEFVSGSASAELGDCRQPLSTGSAPTLRDCLYILQANAVFGTRSCDTQCICDVNGDGHVGTLDALICLRDVLGLQTLPPERCTTCFEPLPPLTVKTRGIASLSGSWWQMCPYEIGLSIFLASDGRGWVSVENAFSYADIVTVSWQSGANSITILPDVAHGDLDSDDDIEIDIGWTRFEIVVTDLDGDGIKDSGTASATIICKEAPYYYPEEEREYVDEVAFELGRDDEGAILFVQPDGGLQPLFTFADALRTRATRALLRETLDSGLGLHVDGEIRAATVTPIIARGPFASAVSIDPIEPLPFAATIGIAAVGAVDAWGTGARFSGYTFDTVADPGPLTDNPGFEMTGGWLNLDATTRASPFDPVEGLRLARVADAANGGTGQPLVGYLDVPAYATALRFQAALDKSLGDCSSTSISLYTRAGATTRLISGNTPWTEIALDLTAARGDRAVLRATPSRYSPCAPGMYEMLVLDGFRVE